MRNVSVVIPTRNRIETLLKVLPSYFEQESVLEVVIVDDGSTDGSFERLTHEYSTFKSNYPEIELVLHRNAENRGTPSTRNIGAKIAKGEFVFYGEDDLVLPTNHIAVLVDHFKSSGADLISGRRIWMRPGESYETSLARADNTKGKVNDTFLALTNCELKLPDDTEVFMLDASILVKKSVFEMVEYEEERSKTFFWREETDFQISCAEKGLKLVFCPHTASFHLPKVNDRGGSRTGSILRYNWQIILNNWYFLHKHKDFLEKRMCMGSIYSSFSVFLFNRIWTKNLLVKLVEFKKWILS